MTFQPPSTNLSKATHSFSWGWVNFLLVLCATLLTLTLAFWTLRCSETALDTNLKSKFTSILKIEAEAVREWVTSNQRVTRVLATDPSLMRLMSEPDIESSKMAIHRRLNDIFGNFESRTCWLTKPNGTLVTGTGEWQDFQRLFPLDRQSSGTTKELPGSFEIFQSSQPENRLAVIRSPIKHPTLGIVGTISVGHNVRNELGRILVSSQMGKTGETVAFDQHGTILSESRAVGGSERIDFLATIHRDDVASGKSTTRVNLNGQSDQHGEPVLSASLWMPQLGLGLITKMDAREASAPLIQIRWFLWTFCGLLALTTISTFVYRYYLFRSRKSARLADLAQRQLGPYQLDGKVGEGGMGVVYRAKHSLLRRPTAVKILPPSKSSQKAIERFEREVQFTSQLKHPNTIAIYDYGRTENGLFYYAMELLDGINLEQLVQSEGALPDGRVIHILQQVCNSLREAHRGGLIHRDIKPANIMLCDQGGALDMVKVLDFGMVRSQARRPDSAESWLSGTPAYMAPEAFTDPASIDARVDIFAVGAVGFYLLTGSRLFEVNQLSDLLRLHQAQIEESAFTKLSAVSGSSDRKQRSCDRLLRLIARCVSTDRSARYATIEQVLSELGDCCPQSPWSVVTAHAWWNNSNPLAPGRQESQHATELPVQSSPLAETTTHILNIERGASKSNIEIFNSIAAQDCTLNRAQIIRNSKGVAIF